MDDLNKRVVMVLEKTGKGKGDLAQLLQISSAQLSHIFSGRNKPGVELLQKILLQFQQTDALWLLTGLGEMEKNDNFEQQQAIQLSLKKAVHRLKELELIAKELELEIKPHIKP